MEDKPEHQHQLDRRVRVPGLTARRDPPWCLPPSEDGFVQAEGQVTAPLQANFVGRPVLDPIAGLRDAVTASGIVLERHAPDRNGSAAAGPPPQFRTARCTNASFGTKTVALARNAAVEVFMGSRQQPVHAAADMVNKTLTR